MLKKMVEESWCEDAALLHPVEDRERFREVVAFPDLTTLIFMQLHDHAEELWRTAKTLQDLPQAISAHSIESLCQVYKGDV